MKLYCFAILLVFTLFSPTFCDPVPLKVNINNQSAEIFDATTLVAPEHAPNPPPEPTVSPGITTPEGITIPEEPTTIPLETTVKPPSPTTTKAPTPKPSPNTSTTAPPPLTTTKPTTEAPSKSTEQPTPLPTASPHTKGRQFDGPSFIGGIVLACGLTAIGFVAFKFYKARTERNYHTLSDHAVVWSQEPRLDSCSSSMFLPKTYFSADSNPV